MLHFLYTEAISLSARDSNQATGTGYCSKKIFEFLWYQTPTTGVLAKRGVR
jgi:hypothetical protein